MVSVTLTLADELKEEINRLSWVNWSELIRCELIKEKEKIDKFERFKKIIEKSKLTEEGAIELARKLKRGRFKRLKQEGYV